MVTALLEPLDGAPSRLDDVQSDALWLYIRWDNEHKCAYLEWKAFASSAEFRAGLMKGCRVRRASAAGLEKEPVVGASAAGDRVEAIGLTAHGIARGVRLDGPYADPETAEAKVENSARIRR